MEPVEVFPNVFWAPLEDEVCEIEACYNQAFKICNMSIYFGLFFQGCGKNFCIEHAIIIKGKHWFTGQPKMIGFSCNDPECREMYAGSRDHCFKMTSLFSIVLLTIWYTIRYFFPMGTRYVPPDRLDALKNSLGS